MAEMRSIESQLSELSDEALARVVLDPSHTFHHRYGSKGCLTVEVLQRIAEALNEGESCTLPSEVVGWAVGMFVQVTSMSAHPQLPTTEVVGGMMIGFYKAILC